MKLDRRQMMWSASAAAILAGLGGAGWLWRGKLLAKHYPPSPYDDVFARLIDRDAAARIGQDVLIDMPNLETVAAANTVRARLSHQSLTQACAEDAETARLVEANGWVMPETLALLCALAARA